MIDKKKMRIRRATKTRMKIRELLMPRLSVHRTAKNIYVQLIMPNGEVAASANSLQKSIKDICIYGGNIKAAQIVGEAMALKLKDIGVTKIAFDRSGFKYHGRVKALADAIRSQGLEF